MRIEQQIIKEMNALAEEKAERIDIWRKFNSKHRDFLRDIRNKMNTLRTQRRLARGIHPTFLSPTKQERIEAIEKELAILKSEL